jgi:hypothetical protein
MSRAGLVLASMLALVAAPIVASAVDAPAASGAPATPVDPIAKPLAQRDLVSEKDGVLTIDHFQTCTAVGSGEKGRALQLLVHAEASASQISRDRFVASATRTAVREIDGLAIKRGVGKLDAPPVCHEVGAPQGDVDYELKIVVRPDAVDVHVTDVSARVLAKVANQHGSDECVSDSMGTLHCARSAGGTAVKSNLGQVVCARGRCVRASRGDWQCSRAAGGWAEVSAGGQPECEYGCYSPTSTQCRRIR